jgi:hypothetical protein
MFLMWIACLMLGTNTQNAIHKHPDHIAALFPPAHTQSPYTLVPQQTRMKKIKAI